MEKDLELAARCERTGEDFYFGRGRERDLEQARRCFRQAAQYGAGEVRAEALCNLALLTQDLQARLALYLEAADEGCAHAMNMVGVCMERYGEYGGGLGSALDWYSRAASAGSLCGKHNMERYIRRRQERSEELERAKAEREEQEARERQEKLAACLEAARAWAGQPAAIICIPDIPPGMVNELACDTACELEQSVLLAAWRPNEDYLNCVGFDYGRIGLAMAMDNPYQQGECWGRGRFTVGRVRRKDWDAYRAAVELTLIDINPI